MNISKFGIQAVVIATVGLFAFKTLSNGSVKGSVSPASQGNVAWIVSSSDTLKSPIENGGFEIRDVKPGVYKVIIEAKPPYKNAAKDGITVNDGQVSDVGEIKLAQ